MRGGDLGGNFGERSYILRCCRHDGGSGRNPFTRKSRQRVPPVLNRIKHPNTRPAERPICTLFEMRIIQDLGAKTAPRKRVLALCSLWLPMDGRQKSRNETPTAIGLARRTVRLHWRYGALPLSSPCPQFRNNPRRLA
jgi:hypothetical protein